MQRQSEAFDAIVVGSGISGGWAAKELTERGLRVLLLERGKNIEHVKDYTNARKAPWEYPHRGGRTRQHVQPESAGQSDGGEIRMSRRLQILSASLTSFACGEACLACST